MTGASIAITQAVVYRLDVTSMRFEYRAIVVQSQSQSQIECIQTDRQTGQAVPLILVSPRFDRRTKKRVTYLISFQWLVPTHLESGGRKLFVPGLRLSVSISLNRVNSSAVSL
jgi:hypothetical protein